MTNPQNTPQVQTPKPQAPVDVDALLARLETQETSEQIDTLESILHALTNNLSKAQG